MSTQPLPFSEHAQIVYRQIHPLVKNQLYDPEILNAEEMYREGRGNCMTFAEASANSMAMHPETMAVGYILNKVEDDAGLRTSLHAKALAVNSKPAASLVFDSLDVAPMQVTVTNEQADIIASHTGYTYTWRQTKVNQYGKRVIQRPSVEVVPVGTKFVFPENSSSHQVIMPQKFGVEALHTIAQLHQLRSYNLEAFYDELPNHPNLPTLPKKL